MKLALITFGLLLGLNLSAQTQDEAVTYTNDILALKSNADATHQSFTDYLNDFEHFDAVEATNLLTSFSLDIVSLENALALQGSFYDNSTLAKALGAYYQTISGFGAVQYPEILGIMANINPADAERLNFLFQDVKSKLEQANTAFKKSLKEFALVYDISIEN